MMSWIGMHKFADVIFGITQKTALHYIIRLGQIIYNDQKNFSELVSWPEEILSPDPFCFW